MQKIICSGACFQCDTCIHLTEHIHCQFGEDCEIFRYCAFMKKTVKCEEAEKNKQRRFF